MNEPPPAAQASWQEGYSPPQTVEELRRRYAAGERYFPKAELPAEVALVDSTLEGSVFVEAWLGECDFSGANLRGVVFENCHLKCSTFDGADLRGADFRGSSIEATSFAGAKLEGASFVGAFAYGYEIKAGDPPPG